MAFDRSLDKTQSADIQHMAGLKRQPRTMDVIESWISMSSSEELGTFCEYVHILVTYTLLATVLVVKPLVYFNRCRFCLLYVLRKCQKIRELLSIIGKGARLPMARFSTWPSGPSDRDICHDYETK